MLMKNLQSNSFTKGNPRIINGNGGSVATVDIGAYEFVPVVLAPKSLGFGLQAVGSSQQQNGDAHERAEQSSERLFVHCSHRLFG